MSRSLAAVSAISLILPLALAAPTPKENSGDPPYFPTRKGTKWTYRSDREEETFVVTAVRDEKGTKVVSVGRVVEGRVTPEKEIKLTKAGVIEDSGRKHESTLLKLPAKPGDEWEVETRGPGNVPVKWRRTVRGPEKVKVPAGTFEAIRVENRYTIKGDAELQLPDTVFFTLTQWFAPRVGLVREVVREGTDGDEVEVGALKSFTPGKD